MGGGVIQLVSVGKQGNNLISKPNISFFKYIFKKHTNFSIESIPLNFNQEIDFGKTSVCKIGRHGDLLYKCFLEFELPKIEFENVGWTNGIGSALIDSIELLIGGEIIDKMDGNLLDIYAEYFLEEGKKKIYHKLVGYHKNFSPGLDNNTNLKLYVPLEFWFCRHISNALPLISMQYHDVEIRVKIKKFNECYVSENGNIDVEALKITNCRLYADYIYLDIEERAEFAKRSNEYLIIQHQKNTHNTFEFINKNIKIDLTFNHPVKSLFWFIKTLQSDKDKLHFDYSPRKKDNNKEKYLDNIFIDDFHLLLNGQERFSRRDGYFFRYIEPMKSCKNIPENKEIYNYNFGFNTGQLQPNGFLNFSMIDNSQFLIDLVDDIYIDNDKLNITIYALNYNILRIQSGMGGLLYQD